MMLDSVDMAAAKMPAMIRPVTPIGSSAAMNSGNVMLTPRSPESFFACWLWVNVLKREMASFV